MRCYHTYSIMCVCVGGGDREGGGTGRQAGARRPSPTLAHAMSKMVLLCASHLARGGLAASV